MARVLVLRERSAGERLARDLLRFGHAPLLLPLQEVRLLPFGEAPQAGRHAGVILTSPNAVPAAVRLVPRTLAVLAVGARTAGALRVEGFLDVREGAGEGADLVPLADALAGPERQPLLYLAGRIRRPDLEAGLASAGIGVDMREVYDMIDLEPSSAAVRALLGGRPPDSVLLLSAGQCAGFLRLGTAFPDLFRPPPRLLCLSARIRDGLPDELSKGAKVAARPEPEALIALC